MSRIDVLIFGATGFTGRKAVQEFVRLAKTEKFTWGIAGRSLDKLQQVLVEAQKFTGEDLGHIKTVIADVSDEDSLKSMCAQAKIIANCCGPYRLYGEPVIKACISAKTHHLDISGEPQFIETMQLRYGAAAAAAGVFIISACGFDSIPNDMGVVYLQQNFDGIVNSVESYMSFKLPSQYYWDALLSGSINYGTWSSLVHSLSHYNELKPLRKQLYPEPLPPFTPKLRRRGLIHRYKSGLALPFPGADDSIVYRTQRYLYEKEDQRPVQFKAYIANGIFTTALLIISSIFIGLMTMTEFTRDLLLKYPRLFTLGTVTTEGPKECVMNNTKFKFELIGKGWAPGTDVSSVPPNKTAVVTVRGVNPGYGATVTALCVSALLCLRERDRMPAQSGVLTAGAAFARTSLVQTLGAHNLTFTIDK